MRRALSLLPRFCVRGVRGVRFYSPLVSSSRPSFSLVKCHPSIVNSIQLRRFASLPDHTKLAMPALSPTMTSGTIARWNKKEGDKIKAGESMADVETDKATVAFEAVEPGFLAKILVPAGSKDVQIGQTVAIIVEEAEHVAAFKDFKLEGAASKPAVAAPAKPAPQPTPASQPTPAPTPVTPAPAAAPKPAAASKPKSASSSLAFDKFLDRLLSSPMAHRYALEQGIDLDHELANIKAAANGKVVPSSTAASAPSASPSSARYRDVQPSAQRKAAASGAVQSKQSIPHYYLTIDVSLDKLLSTLDKLNAKLDRKLTVADFVLKASAVALQRNPTVNSSWMADAIREYKFVNISFTTQSANGLVAPVLKGVENKSLAAISKAVADLSSRAAENKLNPEETQGGTFAITNIGQFGASHGAPVVPSPQACNLALGKIETRFIPNSGAAKDKQPFVASKFMNVTLSCDHRVVDGAVGAQWLASFKNVLEDPTNLLL